MAESTQGQGIIARVTAALRYAATGTIPSDWFGPSQPIAPQAPETVRGRGWDYQVAINLNYTPRTTERVGFAKLRALADNCGPLRMIIERQKDKIAALEWRIKPKLEQAAGAEEDPSIRAIAEIFERPDREHDWSQWVRALLEQNLVIDAATIYARPTRGGGLYGLELIDGATIKPLIGSDGRRPLDGEAAFQQVLKGLPAVNYTADELLYYPQNWRVDRIYGYSRVEQVIEIVEMTISRMRSQKGYFDHGNIQDGFFTAPVEATPEQVRDVERLWNAMMTPSVEGRRQSPFLPGGFEWHETKKDILVDTFDEWLLRLICYPFGESPTVFAKQQGLGNGSAQIDKRSSDEGGIQPLMQFVQRMMNRVLVQFFQRPDLEFSWVEDRELDPNIASQIEDRQLKNGTLLINEARDRNGREPLEGGDVPMIGGTPLERVLNPPAPPLMLPGPGEDDAKEPVDDGAEGDKPKDDNGPALKKAASDAAVAKLKAFFADYLATKADAIAPIIAEATGLKKEEPKRKIIESIDNLDWLWRDLPAKAQPYIAGIAVPAGKDAVSALGLFDKKTLARVTERATAWANARAAELVGMKWVGDTLVENPDATWSIAKTTRELLRSTVTEQMEAGASTAQMRAAIMEATAFDADRAETIARTEAAIADVQGQIAGWKAGELVAGKQWVIAPDCCDECQELDGEIVGLDDDFPDGDPPLHPNCRCTVVAVLPENMPDADDGEGQDEE